MRIHKASRIQATRWIRTRSERLRHTEWLQTILDRISRRHAGFDACARFSADTGSDTDFEAESRLLGSAPLGTVLP